MAALPETGEKELKKVVRTFENETSELVHVKVEGEVISATPTHPFYSPVKGWTSAVDLRAGDVLLLQNGNFVIIEEVQHEILEKSVKVYNFEVEDFHTYYVGESKVLVHNKCDNEFNAWLNKGKKNNKVYHGMKNKEAVYTGITKQKTKVRLAQHKANKKDFTRLKVKHRGLTRNQARAIEQYYIENGPNKKNAINSISPKNKHYKKAMKWATSYVKGRR